MAQAVGRQAFTAETRVRDGPVHVGFVVDKGALGKGSLRVLLVCPVSIIPQ